MVISIKEGTVIPFFKGGQRLGRWNNLKTKQESNQVFLISYPALKKYADPALWNSSETQWSPLKEQQRETPTERSGHWKREK